MDCLCNLNGLHDELLFLPSAVRGPPSLEYDFGVLMEKCSRLARIVVGFTWLAAAAACGSPALQETPTAQPTVTPTGTASPLPTPTAAVTPAPTSSPTPSCRAGEGSLMGAEYSGAAVPEQVSYQIYLPDCFLEGQVMLPVMYFFHGKPYDETHWLELGVIDVYQSGVSQGRWGEALLVFAYLPEPIFSETDGGPGSYEQEFVDGLLPEVESRYPAGGAANRRMLMGISRGGIWSLEIGLANPELAARIGALSPSLAVNYPRPAYDPFELARQIDPGSMEIFLLAGQDDWARRGTERLAAVMGEAGLLVELEIIPGQHVDSTWQMGLESMFDFALSGHIPDTNVGSTVD